MLWVYSSSCQQHLIHYMLPVLIKRIPSSSGHHSGLSLPENLTPADMFCLINLMRYFSWLINIDMYYIVAVVPPPSYNNILLLDCCGDQPFCAAILYNFCFFGHLLD